MKSPYSEFLGWDHRTRDCERRLEAANAVGHLKWVELLAIRQDAQGTSKYFKGMPCANRCISPQYSMGCGRACQLGQ